MMKRLLLVPVLPFILAACAIPVQPSDGLSQEDKNTQHSATRESKAPQQVDFATLACKTQNDMSGNATTTCGRYQLARAVSQAGKSSEETQSDVSRCKQQAKDEISTSSYKMETFLMGAAVAGAIGRDKSTERKAFTSCMQAKGYSVDALND
jgi:hypothetical protein